MRNDQRQFFLYDMEIRARKDDAVLPPLADIINVWQQKSAQGRLFPIRGGAANLVVGGIEVDHQRDVATLLIRLSDTQAPNSVYSNPAAGAFTEHVKVGGEGADFGCHVIISLSEEAGFPGIHLCSIERVVGLPVDYVRRLLSKYLNYEFHENVASFSYLSPAGGFDKFGQPRMERCCPYVHFQGRPSQTLIDDINAGRLSGVSLIKTEVATPLGGAAYLRKASSELSLSIDHGNLPANLWDSLTNAIKQQAAAFPIAKLAYKLPGQNRTVTVELDAATGAPLQDLYVQTFELTGIFPFLADSSQTIVPHLRDLAVPQLLARRSV